MWKYNVTNLQLLSYLQVLFHTKQETQQVPIFTINFLSLFLQWETYPKPWIHSGRQDNTSLPSVPLQWESETSVSSSNTSSSYSSLWATSCKVKKCSLLSDVHLMRNLTQASSCTHSPRPVRRVVVLQEAQTDRQAEVVWGVTSVPNLLRSSSYSLTLQDPTGYFAQHSVNPRL